MRFLSMVKAAEGGVPPTQQAMDRVEKLIGEGVKAGWQARKADADIGELVATLLVTAGVAVALYTLLQAAFGKKR